MFQRRFQRAVRAIVEAILTGHGGDRSGQRLERVADFVAGQSARLPDFLRPPLRLLTLALDLWPCLRGSVRPLHRLPPEARIAVLESWRRSRLGVRRDLVRLYDSLTILGAAGEAADPPASPVPEPSDG
jgi:hypothetical protein